ncbi:ABC transporter ATP-binding protein [Pseudoxanthomonas winnipegensis]|uniref:ABC transporter ATP-binding protein n=1 Tax=Pseudoxanthomonas winnipegensis TaxID=2480810 RepID=UPI00102DC074|nr:ABC transporter ATP-binding protein [Pseudoxanthomonas winnipegensis]TAA44353.1 ABC transporter ATP-binding protein [Pseudoxanthomonas winnipegensis]
MSSDISISEDGLAPAVIEVDGLAKLYQIYDQPRDRLKQFFVPRLMRMVGKRQVPAFYKEYWALQDVSFQVRRGEAVGIVGRNGAGKSTLLQLICGTLTPTAGAAQVHGRVAALLELGAGFNPEFTGRENVYMSAALLGLDRAEIDERYESILAFADIGDFVNQPVKVYSSGMYVRLAFAVIAHVDADVLIVDEALAVGDSVFVQKCMRFLRAFRQRGTLLFVSHDTGSVLNFCDRALWLDKGHVRMHDSAQNVVSAYMEYCAQEVYGDMVKIRSLRTADAEGADVPAPVLPSRPAMEKETELTLFSNIHNSDGWTSEAARIDSVVLLSRDGESLGVFHGGEQVQLRVSATAFRDLDGVIIGFFVKDRLGQSLFGEHTYTYVEQPYRMTAGQTLEARFDFTVPLLPDGDYSMTVSIAEGNPWDNVQHHWLHDAVLIRVASTKLRYGLVGIPFDAVSLRPVGQAGARHDS